MCGRYTIVSKVETMEKRFNVQADPQTKPNFEPTYNAAPGELHPVITQEKPQTLQLYKWGYDPGYDKTRYRPINARVEGSNPYKVDKKADPIQQHEFDLELIRKGAGRPKRIFQQPMFSYAIRKHRCLVIADAFIEGTITKGLEEGYVIYLKNHKRPFAIAGVYNELIDKATGEVLHGTYALLITIANNLLQKLPHIRMPVILHESDERRWLDPGTTTAEVAAMLEPFESEDMNAYPIGRKAKNPRSKGREVLDPVGQRITPEVEYVITREMKLEGMKNKEEQRMERYKEGVNWTGKTYEEAAKRYAELFGWSN